MVSLQDMGWVRHTQQRCGVGRGGVARPEFRRACFGGLAQAKERGPDGGWSFTTVKDWPPDRPRGGGRGSRGRRLAEHTHYCDAHTGLPDPAA